MSDKKYLLPCRCIVSSILRYIPWWFYIFMLPLKIFSLIDAVFLSNKPFMYWPFEGLYLTLIGIIAHHEKFFVIEVVDEHKCTTECSDHLEKQHEKID